MSVLTVVLKTPKAELRVRVKQNLLKLECTPSGRKIHKALYLYISKVIFFLI